MRTSLLLHPGTTAETLADLYLALIDADITPSRRERARAALQEASAPLELTWTSVSGNTHLVEVSGGPQWSPAVHFASDLVGLAIAREAMRTPGQRRATAAAFMAPGAKYPDVAARAALKRAATFLRHIQPALADAAAGIRVLGGCAVYNDSSALRIVVR